MCDYKQVEIKVEGKIVFSGQLPIIPLKNGNKCIFMPKGLVSNGKVIKIWWEKIKRTISLKKEVTEIPRDNWDLKMEENFIIE